MPKSKQIVVDASVARSAASGPVAGACAEVCREALLAIGERHRIVFSREGWSEWDRHESRFAQKWRRNMVASRKVVFLTETRREELREALAQAALSLSARRALDKDAHLVEAATLTDRIVVSRDEKVRGHFRTACSTVALLREILWANPDIESEQVVPWLRAGAKAERGRRLKK